MRRSTPQFAVDVLAGSGERSSLFSALDAALGSLAIVRARNCVADLSRNAIAAVVDLDDPPLVSGDSLVGLGQRSDTIWLVLGQREVSPCWLSMLQLPTVFLLTPSGRNAAREQIVVDVVTRHLSVPDPKSVVRLILAGEPALSPLEDLVQTVCADPWRVRRMRDLATATRCAPAELRGRCRMVGFARVEHFITCVRLIGFEQLMSSYELAAPLARRCVGIGDPSNMRRQVTRARATSPGIRRVLRRVS
jgi:hypothetical protein